MYITLQSVVQLAAIVCRIQTDSLVNERQKPAVIVLFPQLFSVMSGYTLPLLFINLGGEMLYILDQRLRAQKIAGEKAKKGNFYKFC